MQKTRQILIFFLIFIGIVAVCLCGCGMPKAEKWTFVGTEKGQIRRIIQNAKNDIVSIGSSDGGVFLTVWDSTRPDFMPKKTLRGFDTEGVNCLLQTRDGGYIVAGYADKLQNKNQGIHKAQLAKTDEKGVIIRQLTIDSTKNTVFTDAIEATNGDVWLTGESNRNLWLVQIDSLGKVKGQFTFKDTFPTRGNGLAWSEDAQSLIIVGYQDSMQQKNLLLVEFSLRERAFDNEKTQRIPKAEGTGIVRGDDDNFGIVGTSYTAKGSNILFTYYNSGVDTLTKPRLLGLNRYNDRGWGIAKDLDGHFIIAGECFAEEGDTKSQAVLHKITINGDSVSWSKMVGGAFDDAFNTIFMTKNGVVVAAGSQNKQPSLVKIDPSVFQQKKAEKSTVNAPNYASPSPSEKSKNRDSALTVRKIVWENDYTIDRKDMSVKAPTLDFPLIFKVETKEKTRPKRVHVWVNGKEYDFQSGINGKGDSVDIKAAVVQNGYDHPFKEKIRLRNDVSKVQIEVRSPQSSWSAVMTIKFKRPKLYVLTIGIPYKKNETLSDTLRNLAFTGADAHSLAAVFQTQKEYYKRLKIKSLTSTMETKARHIKAVIDTFFASMDTSDIAILAVSGHGSRFRNDSTHIIWGSDYDKNDTQNETFINYEKEVKTVLNDVKAKRFVFIDACRSFTDYNSIAAKGNNNEATDAVWNNLFQISNAATDYRELLSSQSGQRSYESDTLKHGFFTFALLEALENKLRRPSDSTATHQKTFDENEKDGAVNFQRLSSFVIKRVPELIMKLRGSEKINQTPFMPDSKREDQNNIPILMLKPKKY